MDGWRGSWKRRRENRSCGRDKDSSIPLEFPSKGKDFQFSPPSLPIWKAEMKLNFAGEEREREEGNRKEEEGRRKRDGGGVGRWLDAPFPG